MTAGVLGCNLLHHIVNRTDTSRPALAGSPREGIPVSDFDPGRRRSLGHLGLAGPGALGVNRLVGRVAATPTTIAAEPYRTQLHPYLTSAEPYRSSWWGLIGFLRVQRHVGSGLAIGAVK